jgi:hypothetical protein
VKHRSALSLVEVLIAAVIIGVSALPILELVRSGTARLEVTEIEVAARQLGSDVLERIAGPRYDADRGLSEVFQKALLDQGVRWSEVIEKDEAIAKAFPTKELSGLLNLHDVRIRIEQRSKYALPSHPHCDELEAWVVTVSWADRHLVRTEATFARLVEQ